MPIAEALIHDTSAEILPSPRWGSTLPGEGKEVRVGRKADAFGSENRATLGGRGGTAALLSREGDA